MDKTPLIVTGSPGCGKSYWIQKHAEQLHKQLFVCPCRKDRTLRDGRQKLHVWARRREAAILWLEGADDLTPEAQAFLRRILETHASDVLFILECRDAGRLQEPIRSRCKMKRIRSPTWDQLEDYLTGTYHGLNTEEIRQYLHPNEYSYRRAKQCAFLQQHHSEQWRELVRHRQMEEDATKNINASHMMDYIQQACHPEVLLRPLLQKDEILKEYGKCMEVSGSLWAFLGSALDTVATSAVNQEE
jgi:hypothetical protein